MGWFLLFPYFIHLLLFHFPSHTFSLCNPHDHSALLLFNNSVVLLDTSSEYYRFYYTDTFSYHFRCPSNSSKTASWKNGTDCCEWDGVTCDTMSGHVIGLDLSCSMLQGHFHPNTTIFHLTHLQYLNLAVNNFSGSSIHSGIGDLVRLTHLNLSFSGFGGDIPSTISHLSKLVSLDLSLSKSFDLFGEVIFLFPDNEMRVDPSTWKKLILNASDIRDLSLDFINMSMIRESSLSLLLNLSSSLVSLSLFNTGLQGNFPTDILCLPNLQQLRLSFNGNMRGQLPKSNWSTPLRYLDLAFTPFPGEIPNSIGHLKSLNILRLGNCEFDGLIPLSLWNLTQLTHLELSYNNVTAGEILPLLSNLKHLTFLDLSFTNLEGQLPSSLFHLTQLSHLDLSSNNLEGQLPSSLFHLTQLSHLYLSSNKLVGPIPSKITKLSKLITLNMGYNLLNGTIPPWCYSLPSLSRLYLNDNQLAGPISDFSTYSMEYLTLSNNKLQGSFPSSIYEFENLTLLSLSSNDLRGIVDFHQFSKLKNLWSLDLSFNQLQGDLPIPSYGTQFFSVSNNNLSGAISSTICNASSLEILNLSHNNLSGMVPQCLGNLPHLSVLDLQRNNLHGSIPRNFSKGNAFQTIKLNGNRLQGPLPQSMAHCTELEVLDLGDNNINDTFPSWLETLQELQVLSMRSNKFHGIITCFRTKHPFPKLRIFDVSNNHFRGPLPTSCIENFQGMMNVNDSQTGLEYMSYHGSYYNENYNDSVVIIMKGQSMELERILTIFTTIDLSNNMFEGEIPKVIGELNSLIGLNLSHNGITGIIPRSLSNLTSLEWLDLSWNQLTGEIPVALANLNFLAFLNLSENQLEGSIPRGGQFNTFENVSYEGNPMLCGLPLSKSCNMNEEKPPQSTFHDEEESGFGWKSVVVGHASGVVFGMLLGYNVFFNGKPQWLARLVGAVLNKRVRRTNNRARANRGGMN